MVRNERESCRLVSAPERERGGAEPRVSRRRPMDGAKSLEVQRPWTSRGQGSGTIGRWTQEPGKPSPAHGLRGRGALGRITGEPRESSEAGRVAEGFVVPIEPLGQHNRR